MVAMSMFWVQLKDNELLRIAKRWVLTSLATKSDPLEDGSGKQFKMTVILPNQGG
ncbi:hypothetical protein IG631_13168 [Alternaria alternata]|nr:hypothetical protein IG631_13168 [Alternaria alternata]